MEGTGGNWRAWLRCPWAAGPGNTQTPRPIGGRREACGAWPGFEPTRRAKLAARTASGRVGRAAAGDLSGQQTTSRKTASHQHTQRPGPEVRPPAPGTPAAPHTTPTQPPRYAKGAGTEVPAPCRLTQPLPRRGLRPDDRQSLRRRRIHRNMPPTTAAPRPAPPIRPSKPVRARPRFGLVAGTSGAT